MKNLVVKHEIKNDDLIMYIDFSEGIENKEEYRIVTTSSIVAYFLQKEKSDLLVDDKDIYAYDNVICHVEIEDKRVVAHYYMDKIREFRKNAKALILVPGLRAYYNIYFNLYQNKEYYKIEEYYQTIKKEAAVK